MAPCTEASRLSLDITWFDESDAAGLSSKPLGADLALTRLWDCVSVHSVPIVLTTETNITAVVWAAYLGVFLLCILASWLHRLGFLAGSWLLDILASWLLGFLAFRLLGFSHFVASVRSRV